MSNESQGTQGTQGTPEVGSTPDVHSIDYAVSRLLKEPEKAPLQEEPEDTAEPEESDELESEGEVDELPDEDEGELDEAEEGGDESESEDEAEEGQEPQYYTVKVDGEDFEVTLDELQSGYQRQKDYTKKTQHLAEQRKAYEAQLEDVKKLQEQYQHQSALAYELLNRDLAKFETVNWQDLKENDPIGFLQKQIEVQEIRGMQAELQQRAQEAYEHSQRVEAQRISQHLELQKKESLRLFPDWKDENKAAIAQKKLAEYGFSIGYTAEELGRIVNAKDLLLLDKARRYDELQKTKKGITTKQTAPAIRKVVKAKGIAPKGVSVQKNIDARRNVLRKSGSIRDAAVLMYEMQNSKGLKKPR